MRRTWCPRGYGGAGVVTAVSCIRRSALLVVAMLAPASVAGAAPTLGPLARPATLASSGRVAAWSAFDGGAYHLRFLVGDQVVDPGLAGRSVPFDVDLGVRDGKTVAVFSRCRVEPAWHFGPVVDWRQARGCALRQARVSGGAERALLPARQTGSAVLPSLSGSRIAFVVVDTAGHAKLRLLGGRGMADVSSFGAAKGASRPVGVDLAARGLAYTTTSNIHGDDATSELWLARGALMPKRVRRTVGSDAVAHVLTAPTVLATSLAVGQVTFGEEESTKLLRLTDAGRVTDTVPGPPRTISAVPLGSSWLTLQTRALPNASVGQACTALTPADSAGCPLTITGGG